ncbi:MAG: PadR family transcriptional regulator PadR [Cyclobacteriaceae bacterium]|jgi:PadR family transcriptional regulator PadR
MKKFQLGEFEEVVMLTVAILYENAYGVSVKREIESRLGRGVSVGALQSALKRLEEKDYLKSHEGEATQERAGRPKRFFKITSLGKQALQHTKETRNALWDAIPLVSFDVKFARTQIPSI